MSKFAIKLTILLSLGLIIVGVWLRFWQLSGVPAAFYHDELDYVVTGQTVLLWGTDLSGTWYPWQLRPLQTINFTAELPAIFHAVTQFIFGSNPSSARLTNGLWGIFTVCLAGLITFNLSKNKYAGLWTSGLLLVNHWHVHISRLSYEATISLFFQLLFLLGLLKSLPLKIKQNSTRVDLYWIFVTCLALFLAYYTYHGAKFTVVAIGLLYLSYWAIGAIKQNQKISLRFIFMGAMLIALVSHSLWINHLGLFGYRNASNLYLWGNTAGAIQESNIDRISFIPRPLLANKYTEALTELVKRYWFVFDPNRLLFSGYEGTHQFSLIISGYISLLELIGIGLFWRFHQKNTYSNLIILLILISPIATLIAGYQAILRSGLTYALLIIISGWGIGIAVKKYNILNIAALFMLIGISISFGMQYFSRYPLASAENHMLNDRILARYLSSLDDPITVVVEKDTYITARNIAYYNQIIPNLTANERDQFNFPFPATMNIKNVTITTECPDDLSDNLLVVHPNKWQSCGLAEQYNAMGETPQLTVLPSPLDNGSYYYIWHNVVCGDKGRQFIHLKSLSELNIEKLTDTQFCETWIRYEQ